MEISAKLPGDMTARPEEGVNISADGDDNDHIFRADVAVIQS